MSTETDEVLDDGTENNFLDMSDEDILNYDSSKLESSDEEEKPEDDQVEDESTEEDDEAGDGEETEDDADGTGSDDDVADDAVTDKDSKEKDPKEVVTEIDYKKEYERLTASFKANGKDISVANVDEAISLMQMGANYNKKMAALKPNLKLLKLLENNKLLDESKISYLIDLDKKNPEAITKLLKDSGIDPLDVDVNKESEYRPKTYTVDDKELELDEVIGELQDSPTFNTTLDIVGNKWDDPSKQVVADNPQLLVIMNDHVARGIYPIINKEVDRERMLGRLKGLSDLEAYKAVGDAIEARGGFNHLNPTNQGKRVVTPPAKKAPDPGLISKKRAASSTQKAAPSVTPADFNPLAMSDEEFSKLVVPKFV